MTEKFYAEHGMRLKRRQMLRNNSRFVSDIAGPIPEDWIVITQNGISMGRKGVGKYSQRIVPGYIFGTYKDTAGNVKQLDEEGWMKYAA